MKHTPFQAIGWIRIWIISVDFRSSRMVKKNEHYHQIQIHLYLKLKFASKNVHIIMLIGEEINQSTLGVTGE